MTEEIKHKFLPHWWNEKKPDQKLNSDSLFVPESLLSELPEEWFEFVMIVVNWNFDGCTDPYCVIFDDEQTKIAFEYVLLENIMLYVIKPSGKLLWNCAAYRTDDDTCIYAGGEHLRTYCDEKNISYKTTMTDNKMMLSVTDFRNEKGEGEDCRFPINLPEGSMAH